MIFAALAAGVLAGAVAFAQNGTPINPHSNNALTVAVYGDPPYGTTPTDTTQTDATPAFIETINADPEVDLVLHVGDIHSGKQFCTEAYDRTIADIWTAFKDPRRLHARRQRVEPTATRQAEGGHVHDRQTATPVDYADGDPIANLDLVRSLFFADPGIPLGGRNKRVLSQAQEFDPALTRPTRSTSRT